MRGEPKRPLAQGSWLLEGCLNRHLDDRNVRFVCVDRDLAFELTGLDLRGIQAESYFVDLALSLGRQLKLYKIKRRRVALDLQTQVSDFSHVDRRPGDRRQIRGSRK